MKTKEIQIPEQEEEEHLISEAISLSSYKYEDLNNFISLRIVMACFFDLSYRYKQWFDT